MKSNLFLFYSLLISVSVSAQEIISTQGDSYSGTNGNVDFTIGEVVIDTGTDGTNNITQGFHQTNWKLVGLNDFDTNYEADVFPNPTTDQIIVRTNKFEHVRFSLYDAKGKLIMEDVLASKQTPIQVSHFAPGNYSLTLKNDNGILKTFKLIKTH